MRKLGILIRLGNRKGKEKRREEIKRERERVGPKKILSRDTDEVSNGAFLFCLGVKSCGAYHILSRWAEWWQKRGQFLLIPF